MKKLLAVFLVFCLIFSLCACNKEQDKAPQSSKDTISLEEPNKDTPETAEPSVSDTSSKEEGSSKPESEPVSTREPVDQENCSHVYMKASCTEPKRCAKCDLTQGKALGHEFKTTACDKPQVCSRCGEKGVTLGHYYKEADCVEAKHCLNCNKKVGSPLGHNMSGGQCTRCDAFSANYAPTLYFTGNMENMNDKKDKRSITFKYRTRDGVVEGSATIKVQGSSSLAYDKKNYTIKFDEAMNVGWGNQKEYCLKANWIDKTHSRNVVTAKLVGEMQGKYGLFTLAPNGGAVDGFPITVYINGEFHGVYTMNIPKAEWMFGMDENNPNHIVLCGEEWTDEVYFKKIPEGFGSWSVEVGPEDDDTLYKLQRLVRFIKDSSDAEFKSKFDSYLDFDATINYYIMARFAYMRDNFGKNMLLATYDGKVWYPSLYDLDTTWGTKWDGLELDSGYQNGWILGSQNNLLFERLEKNFKKEIAERYFELRKDVLNPNHIKDMFKTFYAKIPQESLRLEEQKWASVEGKLRGYGLDQIEEYIDFAVDIFDREFYEWK